MWQSKKKKKRERDLGVRLRIEFQIHSFLALGPDTLLPSASPGVLRLLNEQSDPVMGPFPPLCPGGPGPRRLSSLPEPSTRASTELGDGSSTLAE